MTESNTTPNENNATGPHGPNARNFGRRRGRGVTIVITALVATGVGVFAGKAMSHSFPFGGHHFGHSGGFTRVFAPTSVDEAEKRARRMARHLSAAIDATDAQETRLIDIAKSLASDVYPLRKQMSGMRGKAIELLKAPTIDKDAVETLRAEQLASLDVISKRVATAITDAGEVMTPEQRGKLAERIETFRKWRGWWKGGSDN
ncbi:MAG: Spy/CpxP family protein refolding chaperone [Hyphomicrobiaceae bacterium]